MIIVVDYFKIVSERKKYRKLSCINWNQRGRL